jgi:hypothetical protein
MSQSKNFKHWLECPVVINCRGTREESQSGVAYMHQTPNINPKPLSIGLWISSGAYVRAQEFVHSIFPRRRSNDMEASANFVPAVPKP